MKDKEIIVFFVCIFISFLWLGILTYRTTKITNPEEIVIPRYTQTTDVSLMTSDAVQLEGTCTWHLDVPSADTDRLKIDLIISRTIQKSMAKYSYKDLLNNDKVIFKDIMERIEDCVFSIQPNGFTVWSLSLNKPENVILK